MSAPMSSSDEAKAGCIDTMMAYRMFCMYTCVVHTVLTMHSLILLKLKA